MFSTKNGTTQVDDCVGNVSLSRGQYYVTILGEFHKVSAKKCLVHFPCLNGCNLSKNGQLCLHFLAKIFQKSKHLSLDANRTTPKFTTTTPAL
jgi:hypothetical protein